MDKHTQYVKEHSFNYDEYKKANFDKIECLIFDTESCTNYENDNTGARVYGWGLGVTRNHNMIYGQNLNQFWEVCQNIFNDWYHDNKHTIKITKTKKGFPKRKYIKFPIAVHNLGWDVEFLKYSLVFNGFNYDKGLLKTVFSKGAPYQTFTDVEEPKTFHIVQNNNIVYGCNVYMDKFFEVENKDGSITEIGLCLDFFDSYKIITCAESQFHNYVHGVDPMFYKMGEDYDYDTWRSPTHKQTTLELRYQYNDIFMLREVIEQFYIDGLCGGELPLTGMRTASSIAFNVLKKMTFGEEKTEEGYINYFELDKKTKFEFLRKRIEMESYTGGYTHANHKAVGKTINKIGCSLDINSSYPSQMAYKVFPYGKPVRKTWGVKPKTEKNEVYLIEVGFDFVQPKHEEYALDIFKIGAINSKALSPITGAVSGQEYFCTNIKDGNAIPVYKELKDTKLTTNYNVVLTSVEYEFWIKHFNFGVFKKDEYDCFEVDNLEFTGLKIGSILYYKAEKGKFKPYVDHFTKMKVENKKLGNKPLTNQAKLFLNGAYGKFGTKQNKEEKDLIMDKNGLLTFTGSVTEYEGKEFYRPYASFVTAYGRLQLWNAIIYAVGVENFLYCDTDSIYCNREVNSLIEDMNAIGETIDKTILGKWDVEHVFDKFKVLGQKKYMYHDCKEDKTDLKCCGLPSDARKIIIGQGFDEFYLGKNVEGKKQRKKVIGGCLLLDTLFTIKKIMF